MKIVFLGTSSFAVPVLDMLAGTAHEIPLVVAAPDRPQGRGRKLVSTPVAVRARGLGLPLFQPDRINAPAAVERLRELEPDLIVVVAYGQILGRHVLELGKKGIVNLHGSLLPAWRGAAPIARGIQAGDRTGGVSLQFVVQEVDAGDVIDQQPMDFLPHENAGEASERLSLVAAELLARNLEALEAETAERRPQDPAKATHAAQLEKSEGRTAWHRPAV
ncbi:MAG: methionyl-tRNA formyltransferase, partial [Planctomycetota bacterium]